MIPIAAIFPHASRPFPSQPPHRLQHRKVHPQDASNLLVANAFGKGLERGRLYFVSSTSHALKQTKSTHKGRWLKTPAISRGHHHPSFACLKVSSRYLPPSPPSTLRYCGSKKQILTPSSSRKLKNSSPPLKRNHCLAR